MIFFKVHIYQSIYFLYLDIVHTGDFLLNFSLHVSCPIHTCTEDCLFAKKVEVSGRHVENSVTSPATMH